MNRLKESNVFSGGGVIPLNNRRTLLKSYIWNYVVSNSGKVTLENSIKGDIDLELIGNSVQPTTTGKNIFDESKAVTGRINPDNGELLPETSYISSDYIEVQEGETYFQSGSGDGYYRAFYDMNKKFTSIPTKGVFKITVPVGSKFLRISGRKERFGDWQLEKGDKATPYEPYTGGKPSPRPDNPQEIKSTGRKSKNLFDINYFKDKSNLKTLQCEGFTLLGIICNVKPNTNYTLSANLTEAQYNLNIANKTQRFSLTSSSARTLMSNDDGTLYIGLFNTTTADAVNMDDFMQQYKNIQLEEGDTATCYEAYSDKYLLDLKVTGKNLFPYSNDFSNWKKYVNNSYFGSVTSDESGIKAEALKPYAKIVSPTFKLKPITEYTISAMIDTKDKSMSLGVRIFKNLNVSDYLKQIVFARRKSTNNPQKVSATFITDDLKDTNEVYLQLDCSWGDSVLPTIVTFYDIQLELGNNATNYEPYTEQALTLTSDRPITKWDKLVEQGGEYGWLYSGKIAKEFTFVSKASDENISGRIRRRFKTSLNGKFPQTDKVMCNFLTTDNVRNDYSIGIVGSGDIYIYFYENTGVETLEQANHWLKNLPFEKTIIFERKTTEFIPLSQEEQTQLRNLHSYNGTTNIMVDSGEVPCGIKVAYKQKK